MFWHLIFLLCLLLAVFFMGFFIGARSEVRVISKHLTPLHDNAVDTVLESRKSVTRDTWPYFLMFIMLFGVWLAWSYIDLRKNCIDKWRDGTIIESVEYRYDCVDGVRTPVDSTFTYKVRKR